MADHLTDAALAEALTVGRNVLAFLSGMMPAFHLAQAPIANWYKSLQAQYAVRARGNPKFKFSEGT